MISDTSEKTETTERVETLTKRAKEVDYSTLHTVETQVRDPLS